MKADDARADALVQRDPWQALRRLTPARIALGRVGAGLPTAEVLRFGLAHAQAQDAVRRPFDTQGIASRLEQDGWATLGLPSAPTNLPANSPTVASVPWGWAKFVIRL